MARKMRTEHAYGQRSIGAQNGYDDLTSEGVNDEQEILATMHERADKKMGKVPGSKQQANYGSSRGENNRIYDDRGDPDVIMDHDVTITPDDKKLNNQFKQNDRMYSYLQ